MKKCFLLGLVLMGTLLWPSRPHPVVALRTAEGEVRVELRPDKAPLSAGHFLRHIREKRWHGASFYRVVRPGNQTGHPSPIHVLQGGLGDDERRLGLGPIPHEDTRKTGLKHCRGAVSLARAEPGTASSEFFICLEDAPNLDFGGSRNPDGQGFAVFGQVVSGWDVLERIARGTARDEVLTPPVAIEEVVLLQP